MCGVLGRQPGIYIAEFGDGTAKKGLDLASRYRPEVYERVMSLLGHNRSKRRTGGSM
jgi:hypothetical protein